jgi:oligo-1,6-glucosidase
VKGITSRIDYLKQLGIDVVWTSPIYKSPQADMGYDIADYKDIDPMYGSLAVSTSSLQSSKSAV